MLRPQLAALLLLPLLAEPRGGWATVTLDDVPDYAVAGRPLTLSFIVRQHGVTPMKDVHPTVEARVGSASVRADAHPGKADGHYEASITPGSAGDLAITVNSGWGNSKLILRPIQVVAMGAAAPAAPSDEERGKRLFVGKGCVGCHTRTDVEVGAGAEIGPVLTGKRWESGWLRKFLADPAGNATHTGSFRMPNLGLKQAEIGYLATFLNGAK